MEVPHIRRTLCQRTIILDSIAEEESPDSQHLVVDSYFYIISCWLNYHFVNLDSPRSKTSKVSLFLQVKEIKLENVLMVQHILHSSFPCYIAHNYHDGMAICHVHGASDLFSTFICNTKWGEITDALWWTPVNLILIDQIRYHGYSHGS